MCVETKMRASAGENKVIMPKTTSRGERLHGHQRQALEGMMLSPAPLEDNEKKRKREKGKEVVEEGCVETEEVPKAQEY